MRTGERQSFAARVREELIRLPAGKACCMLSEISALTQTSGHLAFRGGGWLSVSYRLEDAGVARRLFQLLKKRLNVNPTLHFTQSSRLGGRKTCVLTLTGEDARTLLDALHMTETDENGQLHIKRTVPRHPMTRQCCRKAFLRGTFLGAGTVTNPEKGYHFEWKADDAHLPQVLGKLLEKCDLPFHSYERSGQQVVYLKGAQQIADVLALMGAGQGGPGGQLRRTQRGTDAGRCPETGGSHPADLPETGALHPAARAAGTGEAPAGEPGTEPEGTGRDAGSARRKERDQPPDAAADGSSRGDLK